jgi:hypothetical protein
VECAPGAGQVEVGLIFLFYPPWGHARKAGRSGGLTPAAPQSRTLKKVVVVTKRASGRSRTIVKGGIDLPTGVSVQRLNLQAHRASSSLYVPQRRFGSQCIVRIEQHCNACNRGTSSRRSSSRFATNSALRKLTPVRLPPGRARLDTRPNFTGSSPRTNATGIVEVAALAANIAGKPDVTITAAWRRTRSPARSGREIRASASVAAARAAAADLV